MRPMRHVVCIGLIVLGTSAPAFAQADGASPRPVVTFDGRPTVRIGDIGHVDFRVKTQADWRDFPAEPTADPNDAFDLHRARVGVGGTLLTRVEFQVERDLRDAARPWRDVFVDVRTVRRVGVQAGHFKIPFGLDQLTSVMDLDFMYRSLAGAYLTPGRDVGLMVHGRSFGDRLRYQAGAFEQGGDNLRASERTDTGTAPTVAGRVVVKPWAGPETRSPLRSLALGVAFTDGRLPDGPNSLRGKTAFGDPIFEALYVGGRRVRVGAEVQWRVGPASLQGEFIRAVDQRRGQGIENEDLPDAVARGWYVGGTWVVTGERKKDTVKPARPLSFRGYGAVEFVARAERMALGTDGLAASYMGPRDTAIPLRADTAWTGGVNWYLNDFARVQVNVVRERREAGVGLDRGVTWSRLLRLQFGF